MQRWRESWRHFIVCIIQQHDANADVWLYTVQPKLKRISLRPALQFHQFNQTDSFRSKQLKWKFANQFRICSSFFFFCFVCIFCNNNNNNNIKKIQEIQLNFYSRWNLVVWIVKASEWWSNIDCKCNFSIGDMVPEISVFWIFNSNQDISSNWMFSSFLRWFFFLSFVSFALYRAHLLESCVAVAIALLFDDMHGNLITTIRYIRWTFHSICLLSKETLFPLNVSCVGHSDWP